MFDDFDDDQLQGFGGRYGCFLDSVLLGDVVSRMFHVMTHILLMHNSLSLERFPYQLVIVAHLLSVTLLYWRRPLLTHEHKAQTHSMLAAWHQSNSILL